MLQPAGRLAGVSPADLAPMRPTATSWRTNFTGYLGEQGRAIRKNGGKISWDESAPLDNHPYKNTGKDSDVNFGYVLGISSQIVPPFSWKELSFMFTSDTYESMMIAL